MNSNSREFQLLQDANFNQEAVNMLNNLISGEILAQRGPASRLSQAVNIQLGNNVLSRLPNIGVDNGVIENRFMNSIFPPAPVRSAEPLNNPAIISNLGGFLQRHRNENIRKCWKAAPPMRRDGLNKIFTVRKVNNTGRESFCTATLATDDAELNIPEVQRDVPRGLAASALASFTRETLQEGAVSSECSICMCDIEVGEKYVITPRCSHKIHDSPCASQWFTQSTQCPSCRENCGPSVNQVWREELD
jgi:hypothetical protein